MRLTAAEKFPSARKPLFISQSHFYQIALQKDTTAVLKQQEPALILHKPHFKLSNKQFFRLIKSCMMSKQGRPRIETLSLADKQDHTLNKGFT
jgi:hypothetical protein